MPVVQIDMLDGRTVEQKRKMAKEVTEVIARTCNCPEEAITIVIRECPREHIAKAGVLMSDNK